MPTSVALALPLGRYHATPWGHHVNEAAVEWPPSPWRLLRAFYAVWQNRLPELDASTVEDILRALVDPPTFRLPPWTEAHTRHYLPDHTHMRAMPRRGPTTDYSEGARDRTVDSFMATERDAVVGVTWPVDLRHDDREVLSALLAGLPYLGRAESVCDARLVSEEQLDGTPCEPAAAFDGARTGDLVRVLSVRPPLDLRSLTRRPSEVRSAKTVDPPGTYWQPYVLPRNDRPSAESFRRGRGVAHRATAVRWAVDSPALPSIRIAVAVADVLRQACMSRVGDPPSPLLAGKDSAGAPLRDHRHAHYLAFDADRDKLLDHVVVWVPGGLAPREVGALAALTKLRGHGLEASLRLGLEAVADVDVAAKELVGPSRRWLSHTPFAPPRHAKRRQAWDEHVAEQVCDELRHRGLPEPVEVRPVASDWLAFRRHRVKGERLADARRASGLELAFAEPVTGPIAIGALSHFGLGLFLPLKDD